MQLLNYEISVNAKNLSEKLTADDVIRGECEISEKLFDFMCNIIEGPDIRCKTVTKILLRSSHCVVTLPTL